MVGIRKSVLGIFAAMMLVAYFAPAANAQAAGDASGTWKWTQQFGGGRGGRGGRGAGGGGGAPGAGGGAPAAQPGAPAGQPGGGAPTSQPGRAGGRGGAPIEMSLTLKQDGEKLTGQLLAPGRGGAPATPVDIKDGSVKNGEVTFKIVRSFNGTDITTNYKGKLDGDKITGTSELEFNGNPISSEWNATRSK